MAGTEGVKMNKASTLHKSTVLLERNRYSQKGSGTSWKAMGVRLHAFFEKSRQDRCFTLLIFAVICEHIFLPTRWLISGRQECLGYFDILLAYGTELRPKLEPVMVALYNMSCSHKSTTLHITLYLVGLGSCESVFIKRTA